MLTREQILGQGLTRHAVQRIVGSDQWRRMAPGVYYTVSSDPPWIAWAWAGFLIGGERARIGGPAALRLAGLIERAPSTITVLIPPELRRRVAGPWLFRQDQPGFRQPIRVGAPARISVDDATLDVVGELRDPAEVIGLVTSVVQSRGTTAARLLRRLEQRSRMRHRALLSEVLSEVAAGVRSPLELRYLREVERAHALPTGSRQVRRRGTECDVWYAEFGVLVELDGLRGHTGEGAFRDLRRDNRATTDGLATLRYGWRDVVGRPCEVAAQVAENLTRRGWAGVATCCARCSLAA